MNRLLSASLLCLTALTFTAASGFAAPEGETSPPKVEPRVVDPGPPPSDAIVLFDGKDLSQWKSDTRRRPGQVGHPGRRRHRQWHGRHFHEAGVRGLPVAHRVGDAGGGEGLRAGPGQQRRLSASRYEIQVLDSYNNKTYFDGQAGAVYKQHAPLVNVCRKPGEWQAYDIIYHAPRFDDAGKLLKPGTVTVLQNGVLIQDNVEIKGPTSGPANPKYKPHPLKQPLALQDHGNPVRYRNIWIREL